MNIVFGRLFGNASANQSGNKASTSNAAMHELMALRVTMDLKNKSLTRLLEETQILIAENDHLRSTYVKNELDAVALRNEIDRQERRYVSVVAALCGVIPCPNRVAQPSEECTTACAASA